MTHKIYTGEDRAKELGFKNFREMIFTIAARNGRQWNGQIDDSLDKALHAHIDAGRWAVMCECGTGAYADPYTPLAFCSTCGNMAIDGDARLVIFPEQKERLEIEAALMEREINTPFQIGTQTIHMPKTKPAIHNMHRSWAPGQSVKDLRREHKDAKRGGVNLPPILALLEVGEK